MNPILAITPGTTTLYRVWMLGRVVCATNIAAKAVWAKSEARLALIDRITGRKSRPIHTTQQELAA